MAEIKPKLHRYLYGYKGYLVKQGKVFRQWSSRYFVLEKRKIKYYENDSLQTLLGEMVIDSNAHLYDISEEVDSMKNLFYVVGKSSSGVEESLFLSAPSEKEKQDWIEAITDAVHDGFKQIFQPDLWASDFYPYIDVGIFYRKSGVAAENGNIIRPSNTDYAPDVVFKGVKSEDRFSFIMLDIDPISSIENPSNKFFLHWGVINISGLDIKTGEELAPYVPPAPVYNSGLHRFFFILFKQRTFISSIVLNEITELFHKRDGFPFMKWVRLMDFADPAGINGFYAGWEDYCDDLHARLNYVPPETFRSPIQESAIKKELTRKRIEQAMADLYRDLTLKDVFVGCDQPIPAPNQVPISLQISFPSLTEMVKDGQIISVSSTLAAPTIVYEDYAAEDFYYTLVLTDPDFPSRVNPSLRELVHWVVVNIPSNRISEGKTVLEYLPPAPPYSSGLHRYVFCLYKQVKKMEETEIVRAATFFQERKGIKSYEWIKSQSSYYSTNPIGLEAFITEWDDCVDNLHEQMDWIPPQPYRSRKQSVKLNSPTEDLEDIETVREARVAELEYELKTTVLQTIAQLHSGPVPSVSPKPEPIKSGSLMPSNVPQNVLTPLKEEVPVRSISPAPPPPVSQSIEGVKAGERSELPPLPPTPLRSSTLQLKDTQVTVKAVTSTVTTTVKSTAIVPDDDPGPLRNSAPSPVPPTQTLRPQFSVGIVPEHWTDRQHLEKAPLERQNGLNERDFVNKEPSAASTINLASGTKSSDDIIPSSTHSSVSLRGLAILAANDSTNKPPEKSPGVAVNSTVSPVKTFTITNADDLDALLAPSPPGAGKQEVENYDDDDEIENSSAYSKVSSSNASAANKSKPAGEAPDHRSNPQSLFNRIGLFKAQSQYMPSSRDSENVSTAKPKKIAASSSMYFKSPSAEDPVNKAPKKLTTSSSMYFKAFDNTKLTDFKTPEDSADAVAKCSTFDISSPTVFEGEIMKKKFSTDFMFKDSIIWIDSVSKSLHWGKSVTERRNPQFSKYIFLNRVHGIDQAGIAKPLGEMKGIFKSVDTNGTTVIVHLESEEFLELKFSVEGTPPTTKRISDWVKVIRALSG